MKVNPKRVRNLNKVTEDSAPIKEGPAAYWMSRDQRIFDNWALFYGLEQAQKRKNPLVVFFCLTEEYPGANFRHYAFMLEGLKQVYSGLKEKNIPFYLLRGEPVQEILSFLKKNKISLLVTDFDPLKIKKKWKSDISSRIKIPFLEVDAHNIVPCWQASPKQEYGAYTLRPKINRLIPEYLEDLPELSGNRKDASLEKPAIDFDNIMMDLRVDRSVSNARNIRPGEKEAIKVLASFLDKRINGYGSKRNSPENDIQSGLSPYMHFGNISAQRIALEVMRSPANIEDKEAFLEELIIRRELSDNYCFYNMDYANFNGFPGWARNTLDRHRNDPREYIYSLERFEHSQTHDLLWNAAQNQMTITGKMHGYMRMYWAKKILEWTSSPEEAQEIAIYLNDRYSIDGRDPNGYTGIAWSIGGLHDRAWGERQVFGKIRYMSYAGARRKFDVEKYIEDIENLK